MSAPPEVVLFGRPGCHLCEDARQVLWEVRRHHPFTLRERDIETDDDLLRRYLERIPVVAIDGVERFELFVDAAALAAALQDSRPAGNGD
jgi:glutaredoxin